MKDNSLFAFDGLWDRWRSPDGSIAESCTIQTTTRNQLLTDVDDRRPAILHRDRYETWLTASPEEGRGLTQLLVPFEAADDGLRGQRQQPSERYAVLCGAGCADKQLFSDV
jgi:putative SOS response-associated peptidase YedK